MNKYELIEFIKKHDEKYKEVEMKFYELSELEMIKTRIEREIKQAEKRNEKINLK
jgi:hypothetical protein